MGIKMGVFGPLGHGGGKFVVMQFGECGICVEQVLIEVIGFKVEGVFLSGNMTVCSDRQQRNNCGCNNGERCGYPVKDSFEASKHFHVYNTN